ncbi:MAG: His/Gly/Thr/Pro-type tRNA ligase C-terminal domain-containing protein [Candidatus Korarchaeum sp.]|nr:His/Gly/Thr/Pro-type tRNA ligase C-terminal domain-containing protein [Candidatus Korarchaeum sp.]
MLREGGISTSLDLMRRSQSGQREYANKMGVRVIAFVGPSEEETETVTLYSKDIRKTVRISEVVSSAKELLSLS